MKHWWVGIPALLLATSVWGQQSRDFGEYTVHYSAINTSQLEPQVAQAYNIQRSSSRALLNITVMANRLDGPDEPVHADVRASARNLTGQVREIDIREISESEEAIYYIGEFRVNNMEMFDFTVYVTPLADAQPMELKFRQQFYTE